MASDVMKKLKETLDGETYELLLKCLSGYHPRVRDLRGGDFVNMRLRLLEVIDVRSFRRNNGTIGRLARLIATDGDDEVIITLWDDDVKMIERVKLGSDILIVNFKVKNGKYGLELSPARNGKIIPL